MNLDEELLQELRRAFRAEAGEYVQQANRCLLRLEEGVDPQAQASLLQELFRLAHSLKGSARAIGLIPVGDLAHRMETLLDQVQEGVQPLRPELFDLLYRTLDAIQDAVEAPDPESVSVEALCQELERAAQEGPGEPASSAPQGIESSPQSPRPATPPGNEPPGPPAVSARERATPVSPSPWEPLDPPGPAAVGDRDPPLEPEGRARAEETVRLSTAKLDALMGQVGELQVLRNGFHRLVDQVQELHRRVGAWERRWQRLRAQSRGWMEGAGRDPEAWHGVHRWQEHLEEQEAHLAHLRREMGRLVQCVQRLNHRMGQAIVGLQDDVQQTRLVPLSGLLETFPRMVRDLAREQGKEIRFQILGDEVEVDRAIVEQLKAPLIHLLRNAVDHGIEGPEEREAAGKPRQASLVLEATQQGDGLRIQVRDDGRGIDPAMVLRRAVERGIIGPEERRKYDAGQALWLIFRPGFSTRSSVSSISGRGVGLDVVRDQVERLQGTVDVESRVGQGTTFTLAMPLTVAATLCLVVRAGGQRFAMPVQHVHRLLQMESSGVVSVEGGPAVQVDGRAIPVAHLAGLLGLEARTSGGAPTLVALECGPRIAACWVDGLEGIEELVVKPLPDPLYSVVHVAGVALRGSGEPILVLHVGDLLRAVGSTEPVVALTSVDGPARPAAQPEVPRILVVDDSTTTRTLLRSILRSAGYTVEVATDGHDAWERLAELQVDLVVSDVDMPRMDGLELTARIRQDSRLERLPVILVTSLDSESDRRRGIEAGADAYIVKGAFDQQHLLDTIRQFV